MENFKAYSFSRLISTNELEFFFILGLPNPEDYSEDWDATGHTVVGYLAMYKNHVSKEIENVAYYLPDYKRDLRNIERYTHQFAFLQEGDMPPFLLNYRGSRVEEGISTL